MKSIDNIKAINVSHYLTTHEGIWQEKWDKYIFQVPSQSLQKMFEVSQYIAQYIAGKMKSELWEKQNWNILINNISQCLYSAW